MDNREIAHAWAHQSEARSNRDANLWFDGPTLYSYATAIALLGDGVALISDHRYSNTTSRHQSLARSALRGNFKCFYVPEVCTTLEQTHAAAKNQWKYEIEWQLGVLGAHPRRTTVRRRISSLTIRYRNYSDFFHLNWEPLETEKTEEWKELAARFLAEKKEKEAEAERRRNLRLEERRIAQVKDLQEWREGARLRSDFEVIALRISADGSNIETSRGAAVPVAVAESLWPMIVGARLFSHSIDFPKGTKVGEYFADRVESDGTLVIGCHKIPFSELEAMANKLHFV